MDDKEKRIYDAILKIERNIDLLDYVHDSITEGTGKDIDELFGGAVLEIILNIRESIDRLYHSMKHYDNADVPDRKSWQFVLYEYLVNNEITIDQYIEICKVLGIPISLLD